MKLLYVILFGVILTGCVVNPPVTEEIIKKPNGQIVEKDIVTEPVVSPVIETEVEPVMDPLFEPVVDVPVVVDGARDEDGGRRGDGRRR
ncbi:MAG: hypothetical protein FWF35_02075 [Elusimicrobia bacterium]|nr:hypothetical protein [Elusimicrobiota bacterium]